MVLWMVGVPKRRRFCDALFLKMEDSYADSFLVIWVAEKMLENQRNSNVLFCLFAFFSAVKQRVLVNLSGFALSSVILMLSEELGPVSFVDAFDLSWFWWLWSIPFGFNLMSSLTPLYFLKFELLFLDPLILGMICFSFMISNISPYLLQ